MSARSWRDVRAEAIDKGLISPPTHTRLSVGIVQHEGSWLIQLPALCHEYGAATTQAGSESDIPRAVCELIALELDVPLSSVTYPDPDYPHHALVEGLHAVIDHTATRVISVKFPGGQVVEPGDPLDVICLAGLEHICEETS